MAEDDKERYLEGRGSRALEVAVSPRLRVRASARLRVPVSPRLRVPASARPRVSRPAFCLLLSAFCILFSVACRQDMQDQPKMKPFRSTTFFRDGISSRPPVRGTVPRGYLRADKEFFTGKKITATGLPAPGATGQQALAPARPAAGPAAGPDATQPAAYPDDVDKFPFPVTLEIVKRGEERYQIFCSLCHGMTGNGDGMIVRRGFRRAASFHDERLRQAPVGHYFDAITNGWGAMPPYAAQIAPHDRWAIVAYIRALQLSQQNLSAGPAQSRPQSQPPASQTAMPAAGGHNQ